MSRGSKNFIMERYHFRQEVTLMSCCGMKLSLMIIIIQRAMQAIMLLKLKVLSLHLNKMNFLRHQLPISKMLSVHDPSQRIAENVGIVAVVESPFEFLDVAIHVLDAHLVEYVHERPLEQAPYAFYAVCVNISHNPFFLGMSHSLMARIMVGYADIRPQFIRVYSLGFVFHGTLDEVMESAAFDVRDTLDANLTFALDGSPTTHALLPLYAWPFPFTLPPTSVSSTSTIPKSAGPSKGSFPIACRILWQRYQAVLQETPRVRFI